AARVLAKPSLRGNPVRGTNCISQMYIIIFMQAAARVLAKPSLRGNPVRGTSLTFKEILKFHWNLKFGSWNL
ncbi:MAG: hypothetical protein WD059_05120, partial [Balneolaceae bacterium]